MIDIKPPEWLSRGPWWLQEAVNSIIEFAIKTRVYDINAGINQTPKGLSISVGASGGIPEGDFPWKTTFKKPANTLSVFPGTLNGLLPSNIFSPIACSSSGLYYLKAKVTTNGKAVTAVTLAVENGYEDCVISAVENSAPTTLAFIIAAISDGDIFQVQKTNIVITPTVAFIVSRTPPIPGDEPFVRWWTWQ